MQTTSRRLSPAAPLTPLQRAAVAVLLRTARTARTALARRYRGRTALFIARLVEEHCETELSRVRLVATPIDAVNARRGA